jgi:hypothetical protein
MDLVELIDQWTSRLVALAWSLFLLTWTIAWTLRGAPIPSSKIKRVGTSLAEDAIWAAFWLALGSTVFAAVVRLADIIEEALGLGG